MNLEESYAGTDGLLSITRGSKALATYVKKEGWDIEGVIVLEMVAYADDSIPQRTPEGLPIQLPGIHAYGYSGVSEPSLSQGK